MMKLSGEPRFSENIKLVRSQSKNPRTLPCREPYVVPAEPKDKKSLLDVYTEATSIVISRHPFNRLVSLYYNLYKHGKKLPKMEM